MLRAISHLQRAPVARTAASSSLRRTSLKAAASAHSKRCGCGNCARSFSVQSQTHYDIPKTQKAIVFEEKGAPIRVRDDHPVVQPDELKPGEVLVRLAYTGVCHTDLHIWRGDIPGLLPLVGGHEGTGYVAAIGKHTHTNLKIGDPVGVKWLAKSCLGCEDCRKGHESTCAEQQVHGFTIDGSFQQWCVSYADHLTPIPAEVELAEAAPVLCAGVTVYHALKKVDGSCGETVVVTGAGGGLGHMACQYARSMGFRVIAVDSGEDKKKLVESYGVAEFIDYKEESDVVAKVKELTNGRGAHVVLVATGGGDPYNGVQNFLRSNGTVLVVGAPDVPFMQMDVHQAIQGEQRILGSMVGNRQDAVEALSLIASGDVHTTYTVEKLENLASVFERMEQRKLVGRVVLDCE